MNWRRMHLGKGLLVALASGSFLALALRGAEPVVPTGGTLLKYRAAERSLKDVLARGTPRQVWQGKFQCEKRVEEMEVPLLSRGQITFSKDNGGRVSLRMSTDMPYVSDLILTDGKSRVLSQHEQAWTTTSQSTRPGMTAVILLIAGCAVHESGELFNWFRVREATGQEKFAVPSGKDGPVPAEEIGRPWFVLEPTNKDIAMAVHSVTLGFQEMGQKTGAPVGSYWLKNAAIETAQGDQSRYEFSHPAQISTPLPAEFWNPPNPGRSMATGGEGQP